MSVEPDFYASAALINGLPTVTVPPKPYHRKVTNIVVGNGVPSGVNVYRGLLGSVPVAQNTSGANNTVSGVINLPAGQQLFIVWTAVGSPVSSAFARVSSERSDSPLVGDSSDVSTWTVNPVTSITLPTGATSGLRIVLDGTTDQIQMFDAGNNLVVQIDPLTIVEGATSGAHIEIGAKRPPSPPGLNDEIRIYNATPVEVIHADPNGITAGNDLTNLLTANYVRLNVTDAYAANPALEIQPGASSQGNWIPAQLHTTLLNSGLANEEQTLTLLAPAIQVNGYGPSAAIIIGSGAHDSSYNGGVRMEGDAYSFQNHNGSKTYYSIDVNGNWTIPIGVINQAYFKVKTAEPQNNSVVLTPDPELQFVFGSAGQFRFEGMLWRSSPAAAGFDMRFNSATGVAGTDWEVRWSDDITDAFLFNNAVKQLGSSGAFQRVRLDGIFIITTPPITMTLDWAQHTANAGPTSLLKGSNIRCERIK